MEHLCREQARLLAFMREELQSLKEELKREREQRQEAQQRVELLSREWLLVPQQGRLAEEFGQERLRYLEAQRRDLQEREGRERERRERREVEQRIDQLKRELQGLQEAQQERGVQQERPRSVPEPPVEDTRERLGEKPLPAQRAQGAKKTQRPTSFLETTASKPAEERPRRAVWHPHPDDGATPAPADQSGAQDGTRGKMFRKHYDKYLENYQGYVELAERLYRMRDEGEVPPGSSEEREWEKRLHRVTKGIQRTTVRLDILEEHNPELATDDRVSRRASIARKYSELSGSK